MNLLLARHGQTDWNAAGRIQGRTDTPLNGLGRTQAALLARRLERAGERIDRLYTSPQRRALETAEIAGAALGLSPVPVDALREVSFGAWEGCSWTEIARRWPAEYAAYLADRLHTPPPGGESFAALLERVLPALGQIAAAGPGAALVVCHSAVIKAVRCHLDGAPFADIQRRYHLDNAQWVALSQEQLAQAPPPPSVPTPLGAQS